MLTTAPKTIFRFPNFQIAHDSFRRSRDYVKSPFRYPGGKYYALKHIMPFINCVPHDEYREPFVGGGTVFFAKTKCAFNWLNDLETDLITTYQVIADPLLQKKLAMRIAREEATPKRHVEVKMLTTENDLDLAFKTFYLNRTSYSGIINNPAWGYSEGKSSPPANWVKFLQEAGEKLREVQITSLDFSKVISAKPKGSRVLLYLDPPYFHADQKRAYTKPFIEQDHIRLAKLLRETPFLFCLSYDDCPEIRDLYAWAQIYERAWLYNTANIKGIARKKGNELVITNYHVTRHQQKSFL